MSECRPTADLHAPLSATDPSPRTTNPFFGQSLEPILLRSCDGKLSDLRWFRTDWQRGGALTGYGTWSANGHKQAVVVKLPVPPLELTWLNRLQLDDEHDVDGNGSEGAEELGPVVPRVMASGRELNGYDMAWVVMQRLPHGPLDAGWDGAEFRLFIDAVARFHAATRKFPIEVPTPDDGFAQILKSSRKAIQHIGAAQAQRWTQALKKAQKRSRKWMKIWADRPIEDWCHGDLHLANAMTNNAPPKGPAVLFDLAHVHAGHWVEDAVYFESLFWARPNRLRGIDLVKELAAARKLYGLKGDAAWPRLASIRRAMLASAVPAQQASRADPAHCHAALDVLEAAIAAI